MDLHPALVGRLQGKRQRIEARTLALRARQHGAPGQQPRGVQRIHIAHYLEKQGVASQVAQPLDLLDQFELLNDGRVVDRRPVQTGYRGKPGAAHLLRCTFARQKRLLLG